MDLKFTTEIKAHIAFPVLWMHWVTMLSYVKDGGTSLQDMTETETGSRQLVQGLACLRFRKEENFSLIAIHGQAILFCKHERRPHMLLSVLQ